MKTGGIVLCGGHSRRMGRPKLSLPFGPEVMLQRVVRIVSQVVTPVVVVAADDQKLPQLPDDVRIATDRMPDRGPLCGLQTGLEELSDLVDSAFVTACDAPLLQPSLIRRLIELFDGAANEREIVVPRESRHFNPLCAVYRTSLHSRIANLIANDRLRPLFLIEESESLVVDVEELRSVDPDLDSFRNTNSPEDYHAALKRAGYDQVSES